MSEDEVDSELKRFQEAIVAVVRKLSETSDRLRESAGEEEAAIFDAHVEMAQDPELSSEVEERVRRHESPEAAVLAVGEEYAETLAMMEDEYMMARADDVRDVANQVAAELMGHGAVELEALEKPSVILARRLAPSDTARIPKGMALGFITAEGSKTSHVSIMARSRGIPAVVGVLFYPQQHRFSPMLHYILIILSSTFSNTKNTAGQRREQQFLKYYMEIIFS